MIALTQLSIYPIWVVRIALLLCVSLSYGVSLAQWHWIDAQGSKIFSDRPPGIDVPEKNILQRPKSPTPKATTSASVDSGASVNTVKITASAATAASNATKTKEQEANAKLAEQVKATKARNCAAATAQLNTLKSGARIAKTNAKGEAEFLDESGIAAEMKHTQRIADSECR